MSTHKRGDLWTFTDFIVFVTDLDAFEAVPPGDARRDLITVSHSHIGISTGEERYVWSKGEDKTQKTQRFVCFIIDGVRSWVPASLLSDRGLRE